MTNIFIKVGALLFTDTTSPDSDQCIFNGATVFLHFSSNITESQISDIRKQLRFQGAKISDFYHRNVNIVLSDRSAEANHTKGYLSQTRPTSRGALMVRKSLERKRVDSYNFFESVKINGKRVIYLEDTKLGVRPLRSPFIKVEDQSRQFKPLILEMSEWPNLDKMFLEKSGLKPNLEGEERLNEYCGLCEQHYTSINSHIESSMHKKNARDDTKWRNVDKLIARQQTPAEFVESVIKMRADQGKKT